MTKTQISGSEMAEYEYRDDWVYDGEMFVNAPEPPENTDEYWEYLLAQIDQIL